MCDTKHCRGITIITVLGAEMCEECFSKHCAQDLRKVEQNENNIDSGR